MAAFEAAVEGWGADMLELDVHLTRDGEVVVIHDPTVDRTTDGRGAVREMDWREISRLDAGARWEADDGSRPWRGVGVRVPRLEELLERFPDTRLNVEAKVREVAGPLVDLVTRHGAEGRVLLAAEYERARAHVVERYGGPVGASRPQVAVFVALSRLPFLSGTPRVDALQVPERARVAGRVRRILDARLLREAHRRNVAVHVWTVDDETDMRRLLAMGIDAIQTDRPDRLAKVLHEEAGRPLPPAAQAAPPVTGGTAGPVDG
jgi:glycerophosphoryl diester phosphodiesterase